MKQTSLTDIMDPRDVIKRKIVAKSVQTKYKSLENINKEQKKKPFLTPYH
jgi:hypothetical protein